jgi:hypothetical protein
MPLTLGAMLLASAVPAQAIDYPLTNVQATQAIQHGTTMSVSDILTDARYLIQADRETSIGYRPACDVTTPYSRLVLAAAQARVNNSNVSGALLSEQMISSTVRVSTTLFSTALNTNQNAVAVIKQGDNVASSVQREYENAEVVNSPAAGYRRTVNFDFDMLQFDSSRPFTVVISNVLVNNRTGEFQCQIDGRAFP